ncbi:prolyl endopeptidase-like [Triticum dicoccoides]|uniref:prolyl endopeptidase-like n=1 Tax=Triticum dicoccoides TaxID=85692 RepID=UPI0018911902|nr:prolyl endopeptidase-like [Triticum dicoccoides]
MQDAYARFDKGCMNLAPTWNTKCATGKMSISGIKINSNENDAMEQNDVLSETNILICYMPKTELRMRRYDMMNKGTTMRSLATGELLHGIPTDIGSVNGITGRRGDSEVFVEFSSFLTPGIIYRCDLSSRAPKMSIYREITVPGFDRTDFEAKQVFYPSKDVTKIPMFVVSRKKIVLDGSHPALLFGYGGFGMSMTPQFSAARVILMRNLGFVTCVANIRGGGEYGEDWHKAGSLANKQNCFDDFIAAGEFLMSAGYTSPSRLYIEGGSNGGLLVAACINQRPGLFGCALAHVGVMDMLRFHKFTIGRAWACDFGCSEKEEEFHWLPVRS